MTTPGPIQDDNPTQVTCHHGRIYVDSHEEAAEWALDHHGDCRMFIRGPMPDGGFSWYAFYNNQQED